MGHHHHHGGHHDSHHHHHHHSGHYTTAVVAQPQRVLVTQPIVTPTIVYGHSHSYCPKSLTIAYVLWFFFGILGFHRLYLGKVGWFFLYFFTAGIFGIGWFVDLFILPSMVRHYNECEFSKSQFGVAPSVIPVYQGEQQGYQQGYQPVPQQYQPQAQVAYQQQPQPYYPQQQPILSADSQAPQYQP